MKKIKFPHKGSMYGGIHADSFQQIFLTLNAFYLASHSGSLYIKNMLIT